jgi:uncharacterized protein YdeI (YjbR/CyaY-like superfamily)
MAKEIIEGKTTIHCESVEKWREWLQNNHDLLNFVWLIIYRKRSEIPSVYYSEAVDQALCFGWIDSSARKRDTISYYLYMSRRNLSSNWSKINKEKVARLEKQGLIHESGYAMIQAAKENGNWNALDEIEELKEPDDLRFLLKTNEQALKNWNAFSKSARRGILEWIYNARKMETRKRRISETVSLAQQGIKANFPRKADSV